MLVLFYQTIWIFLIISSFFLFKIFFLKKKINKQGFLLNQFILLFYNNSLNLFKLNLNSNEVKKLDLIRFNEYPFLHLIHSKINYLYEKKYIHNFKNIYKLYKFINLNTYSTKLNFIALFNILNIKYSEYIYLIIYKTSFSEKNLLVQNTILNQNKKIKSKINILSHKILKFIHIIQNKSVKFINSIQLYSINFSASNIVKYLSQLSINNSIVLFLRKNKVFNKSRYSRNRQTYRTGAYWCLYVNIIAVIAFYFWFYNFTINFGYIWWFLYLFIFSFVFFKAIKYNFYNPKTFFNEIFFSLKWLYLLNNSIILNIFNFFNKFKFIIYLNYLIKNYFKKNKNYIFFKQKLNIFNKINNFLFNFII